MIALPTVWCKQSQSQDRAFVVQSWWFRGTRGDYFKSDGLLAGKDDVLGSQLTGPFPTSAAASCLCPEHLQRDDLRSLKMQCNFWITWPSKHWNEFQRTFHSSVFIINTYVLRTQYRHPVYCFQRSYELDTPIVVSGFRRKLRLGKFQWLGPAEPDPEQLPEPSGPPWTEPMVTGSNG